MKPRFGSRLPILLLALSTACGGGVAGPPGGAASGGGVAAQRARADGVLVRFQGPTAMTTVLGSLGASVLGEIEGTDWVLVGVPTGYDAAGLVSVLEQNVLVAAASLDLHLETPEGEGSTIPAGGTLLANQVPTQDELERIGGAVARTRATGDGVVVAVLDTGILSSLEGVAGHVLSTGYDFVQADSDPTEATNGVDDDGDGHVDEQHGHGTFVASLVLAVAPDASILPIRVLNADGFGTMSGVANAIAYAVDQGADVINLSLRVPPGALVVADAIAYARWNGVQVVAAAGNGGEQDATLPSPTQDALLVTAVDEEDVRADFASFGGAVDLSAPGVDLHGVYPASPGTAIWSGTSFSTALVAGACALLRELHPTWDLDDVADHLQATAESTSATNPGLDGKLGAGRLDLDAATAP